MQNFLNQIKTRAKANPKRILFAEGKEARVQEAASILKEEALCEPILLTEYDDPAEAHQIATQMLIEGEADGMVAGPTGTSRERILPALKLIGTGDKSHRASAFFFMLLPERVNEDAANGGILLFADCALNIEPNSEQLADIALDTARSAREFGIEPLVAFLSYSTKGSAKHPNLEKVRQALGLTQVRMAQLPPEEHFPVDGEFQVDAALMDAIGERKAPGSDVAGLANVLIFPDLNSGNIAYKLVERLADAQAIGPIIQGLKIPVNEVSRGCTAQDIVNVAAVTVIQAHKA